MKESKKYIESFIVVDSSQLFESGAIRRFYVDEKFVREEVLVNGVWELRRSWGLSVVEILEDKG